MIISLLAAFADTVVVISVDCYFPSEQVWTDAIHQLFPWKGEKKKNTQLTSDLCKTGIMPYYLAARWQI